MRNEWNGTNEDYAVWSSGKGGKYLLIWNSVLDLSYTSCSELVSQCKTSKKHLTKITKNYKLISGPYDYDSGYLDTQLVLCNSGHLVLKSFSVIRNQTEKIWQNMGTDNDVKDC